MARPDRNDNARLQAAIGEIVEILERYDVGALIALAAGEYSASDIHFSKQSLVEVVQTVEGVQIKLPIEEAQKKLKKRVFESRVKATDRQINILCYLAQYHQQQLLPLLGPQRNQPREMQLLEATHLTPLEKFKRDGMALEELPPAYFRRRT